MASGIKLIKISYEIGQSPWEASILALNAEDAVATLRKTVPKSTIKSVSTEGGVHDVSEKCYEMIKTAKSKKVVEPTTETLGDIKDSTYKCPWCEKSYGDPKYLKIHLNKAHNVKETQV